MLLFFFFWLIGSTILFFLVYYWVSIFCRGRRRRRRKGERIGEEVSCEISSRKEVDHFINTREERGKPPPRRVRRLPRDEMNIEMGRLEGEPKPPSQRIWRPGSSAVLTCDQVAPPPLPPPHSGASCSDRAPRERTIHTPTPRAHPPSSHEHVVDCLPMGPRNPRRLSFHSRPLPHSFSFVIIIIIVYESTVCSDLIRLVLLSSHFAFTTPGSVRIVPIIMTQKKV